MAVEMDAVKAAVVAAVVVSVLTEGAVAVVEVAAAVVGSVVVVVVLLSSACHRVHRVDRFLLLALCPSTAHSNPRNVTGVLGGAKKVTFN